MRLLLASMGVVALTCVFAAGPAWAGDDKEAKGGAREEYHVVIDGLAGELLERAAGELKEHHPAVKVKIKEGVLKLHSEDFAAWKKALHALTELGVPVGLVEGDAPSFGALKVKGPQDLRIVLDGKEHKALPSDKEIEKRIGALEEKLVAAREAGREREVEELEQALEHMRKTRKELALQREKHPDAAQPKKHDDTKQQRKDLDAKLGHIERQLVEAREAGREREVAELEQALEKVRHMRKALESRGEQGQDFAELRERLEQAKRALHEAMQSGERRMPKMDMEEADVAELQRYLKRLGGEIGAQRKRPDAPDNLRQRMEHTRQALKHLKEAGLPDHAQQVERALHRMEMAAEGEGREPDRPRAFIKRDAQDVRVVEARRVPEPAPGPRLRAPQPAPRPQDCPPPSVGGFRRGPIHARPPVRAPLPQQAAGGQARVVAPAAEPRPARIVLEGRVLEPAKGQARAMVLRSGEPRLIAVQPAAAPVLVGTHQFPKPAVAAPGVPAHSLAQLQAEMAQLRRQLHRLMLELREQGDEDDDEDDEDGEDDDDERRSPRR